MKWTPRLWITGGALGVALLALLIGQTAFAQSDTSTPTTTATSLGQRFLDRLAQNLGISSDQLQSTIKQSGGQAVDDAVASGELTQQQGDALKQKLNSGQGLAGFGDFFESGRGRMGRELKLDTVASALGLTTSDLQTQLNSGKTLSQIITERGKTVADVVNALVAQAKTELDQQVANGRLTQAQEDSILANLPTSLTNAITNNTFGQGHGRGPWSGADANHAPGTDSDNPPVTNSTPAPGGV